MNGYLVIGVFVVILAVTLYWLQGRQVRMETKEPEKVPVKKIEVVKAKDWPKVEEKEPEKESEPESEQVEMEIEEPIVEFTDDPVEEPTVFEEETDVQETAPEVLEKDITLLSGVGPKYRTLLREAGVTTINQIAASEPDDLLKLLIDTNEKTEITKRPPTLKNVISWIEAAKTQLY